MMLFYVIFLFFEMCTLYFDDSMPFHNDSLAYVNVLFPLLLRYMFNFYADWNRFWFECCFVGFCDELLL